MCAVYIITSPPSLHTLAPVRCRGEWMHLARSYAQSPPGSGRGCIVREVVIDLFSTRSTLV
jgi:hypothetical protein